MESMPKVRIISGRPADVELVINQLLGEYALGPITIGHDDGRAIVTAIMIHTSEIRKMQIAQAMLQGAVRQ